MAESQFQIWAAGRALSPFEPDASRMVRESHITHQLMGEYNASINKLSSAQTAAMRQQSAATEAQTYAIEEQTSIMREHNFAMEGMHGAIEQLSFEVGEGFSALGALFDRHMTTTIALLENQARTQKEIEKLLRYPRLRDAEEMKERAYNVYFKAMASPSTNPEWREKYLADALRDFSIAAEKNDQDYTLHLDIGRILLFVHKQP